jgi:hypothetical protein
MQGEAFSVGRNRDKCPNRRRLTQLVQEIETRLKDGVSRGDEEVIIESAARENY